MEWRAVISKTQTQTQKVFMFVSSGLSQASRQTKDSVSQDAVGPAMSMKTLPKNPKTFPCAEGGNLSA
jgi:hypothetical protein